MTCVAFSIKFAKTNQKFAENSEFCENYSLLFKIIHWCPYSGGRADLAVPAHPPHPCHARYEVEDAAPEICGQPLGKKRLRLRSPDLATSLNVWMFFVFFLWKIH